MADHSNSVQLFKPAKSFWLLSPEIKKMNFRTRFWFCLHPHVAVLTHLETILVQCRSLSAPGHPSTYPVVHLLVRKLATSLDNTGDSLLETPGHYNAFFPAADQVPSPKGTRILCRLQLRMRLLDTLLFIVFSPARLPVESLPSTAVIISGNAPEVPGDIYGKASWLLRKVYNSPMDFDTLIDDVCKSYGSASAAPEHDPQASTPDSHEAHVANLLKKLVDYHRTQAITHSFMHDLGLLAGGLWSTVAPEVGARADSHECKVLDFVTAATVVPFFCRSLFHIPIFGQKYMTVTTASQALCSADLNISGALLVNCEEHLWFATLDMLNQIYSGVATHPTPNWTMIRGWLTNWSPIMHPAWTWPQLCPPVPLNTEHEDDQDDMTDESSPSPTSPKSNPDVFATESFPDMESEDTGVQALPLQTTANSSMGAIGLLDGVEGHEDHPMPWLDHQDLGMPAMQVAQEGIDDDDRATTITIDSDELVPALSTSKWPHQSSSPPPHPPSPHQGSGAPPRKRHVTAKVDSPTFKCPTPVEITLTKEEKRKLQTVQFLMPELDVVGSKYNTNKAMFELTVQHPVPGDMDEMEPHTFLVPKVPEQSHDQEFFLAIHQAALDPPPGYHCEPVLYLMSNDIHDYSPAEMGDFLSQSCIVILPSPGSHSSAPWKTSNGNLSLSNFVDPDTMVECHDLSHSSLEPGREQEVSRLATVHEVMDHIHDSKGHVLNVLDLQDVTGSLGKPTVVSKLATDALAFNSTTKMEQTWDHFPQSASSWLLLGGGGAITRDHVDSCGFNTWVSVLAGPGKIWLVCLGPKNPDHDVFDSSGPWQDDIWANSNNDLNVLVGSYAWQSVYLPEGSTIIMPPHTIHLVLTLGPTLCHGGHFYCIHTMRRTLHARRLDHLHFGALTNQSHPTSWVLLHRMLLYAYHKIHTPSAHKQSPASPYELEDLAHLVMLCLNPSDWTCQIERSPESFPFHLQSLKAQTAARMLSSDYPGLQPFLEPLRQRKLAWQTFLREECWDESGFYIAPGTNIADVVPAEFASSARQRVVQGGMPALMDMDREGSEEEGGSDQVEDEENSENEKDQEVTDNGSDSDDESDLTEMEE